MAFCGNVLELVEKNKIIKGEDFIKWTDFKECIDNIEVYIEKDILPDLITHENILIDAAIREFKNGNKFGLLFFKKDDGVYHSMFY
jgi:hypothetical protein